MRCARNATEAPTASVSSTASSSRPGDAPRLSIVVLPLTNLSDDREQQYFADEIPEDLTPICRGSKICS
jgi:adenylate cyclase